MTLKLRKNNSAPGISRALYQSNETISRPTQSRDTIPLKFEVEVGVVS
jgi:hypothetical protein